MFVTASVLAATRFVKRGEGRPDLKVALLVKLAHSVAILLGASRSGWAIAVALGLGLAPAKAARFSFLPSIPAIAGATVLQLRDFDCSGAAPSRVAAALTGLVCLRWLVALVRRMELHRFSWYLVAVVAIVAVGAVFLVRC